MQFQFPLLSLLLFSLIATSHSATKPAKRSLAFVIDTTASMSSDILQVGSGISQLIQHHWEETLSAFSNFIVSPFNDPHTGPVTNTSKAEVLYGQVSGLHASGGGDCPEKVYTGLLNAIKFALPRSLLLIFTDGLVKDKEKLKELETAIRRKNIVIMTVMTGCCHLNPCPVKEYDHITKISDGAFYKIAKESVHYIMQFIVQAIAKDIAKLHNPPKTFNELLLFIAREKEATRIEEIESAGKNECHVRKAKGKSQAEEFMIGCNRVQCGASNVKVKELRCDASKGNRNCKSVGEHWNCKENGRVSKCFCLKDDKGVYVKVI